MMEKAKTTDPRVAMMERTIANFPEELIMTPQWVLWKMETRGGKVTKVPYQPNGFKAESTNSATWSDCQTVMLAYTRDASYTGIGFVFTEDDPYVGIDLDKCRDPATGEVEPWASKILRDIDTYTELSPSGKGFHLIGKGKLPAKGRRKDGIEMYDSGRYFTVTGEHYKDTAAEVCDIHGDLTSLHANVFGKPVASAKPATKAVNQSSAAAPPSPATPQAGDQIVLDTILASNDASDFGHFQAGNWAGLGYPSQSEGDLALAGMLARHSGGHPDQIDRLFRSTDMVRDKWDEQRGTNTYGEITIAKALEGTSDSAPVNAFMEQMNQRFAVVKNGNQVRILEEIAGGNDFRLYSKTDFDLLTANMRSPKEGASVARAWLQSPQRRSYDGLVFSPAREVAGSYNLWRGFSVQAQPGDCSLFWQFVRDGICAGSVEIYEYIRRYFAHMIQRPWERPEVAIVLRGGQGTGKNTFVDTVGSLISEHFCEISSVDQLTGRFNAHMRNTILMHANEATWGGNKSETGKLKALITDATIPIEMKGQDILHIDNFMRLVVSSNASWPVPVEADDRRFLILDVSPKFKQNTAYFGSLHTQLASGGREALMHDLQSEEISSFFPRNKPKSPFGADMKIRSGDGPTRWLYDCLSGNAWSLNGTTVFAQCDTPCSLRKNDLYADYVYWSRTAPERYPMSRDQFFKRVRELLGTSMIETRPAAQSAQTRERVFTLSSLEHCRSVFEATTGIAGAIVWDAI